MIEAFIDYLQYSVAHPEHQCVSEGHGKIAGFGFYSRGYRDAIGVRRYYGNVKTTKAFVVHDGTAMHNQRVIGWADAQIIDEALTNGANITRIDSAITEYIESNLYTITEFVEHCEGGKVSGTLSKYGYAGISKADVGQPLGIETCYVGSLERRGRNGIFRAYDKGVEFGWYRDIVSRFELEERGQNAHNSAKRLAEGADIRAVVNSRITVDSDQWERVMSDSVVDISRGDGLRKRSDEEAIEARWKWLIEQVAPALREAVEYDLKRAQGNERLIAFLKKSGIML